MQKKNLNFYFCYCTIVHLPTGLLFADAVAGLSPLNLAKPWISSSSVTFCSNGVESINSGTIARSVLCFLPFSQVNLIFLK